jgi:hypothetical protein
MRLRHGLFVRRTAATAGALAALGGLPAVTAAESSASVPSTTVETCSFGTDCSSPAVGASSTTADDCSFGTPCSAVVSNDSAAIIDPGENAELASLLVDLVLVVFVGGSVLACVRALVRRAGRGPRGAEE